MCYPFYAYNYDNNSTVDYVFGVIGKMLLVAQRFERNVKTLELIIGVKLSGSTDEDELTKISDDILRKNLIKNIEYLIKLLDLDDSVNADAKDYVSNKFDEARENRNEIAHEITLCLDSIDSPIFDDVDELRYLIEEYKKLLKPILLVDLWVTGILAKITKENYPPILNYIDNTMKWVFSDEEK